MNDRIKLIDGTVVNILRNLRIPNAWTSVSTADGRLILEAGSTEWDSAGHEALSLASACLRQTGSFDALSDKSAVPFAGKRMRRTLPDCFSNNTERECVILAINGSMIYFLDFDNEISRCAPESDVKFLPIDHYNPCGT